MTLICSFLTFSVHIVRCKNRWLKNSKRMWAEFSFQKKILTSTKKSPEVINNYGRKIILITSAIVTCLPSLLKKLKFLRNEFIWVAYLFTLEIVDSSIFVSVSFFDIFWFWFVLLSNPWFSWAVENTSNTTNKIFMPVVPRVDQGYFLAYRFLETNWKPWLTSHLGILSVKTVVT